MYFSLSYMAVIGSTELHVNLDVHSMQIALDSAAVGTCAPRITDSAL
jgi:hypothetical protein